MLDRAQRVPDHVLHKQIGPYLMEDYAQVVARPYVCQHDEFQTCRCFVVVEFVFSSSIGDELVFRSTQLSNHVAKSEYYAKNQLGIVRMGALVRSWDSGSVAIGLWGSSVGRWSWGCPAPLVNAFSWGVISTEKDVTG